MPRISKQTGSAVANTTGQAITNRVKGNVNSAISSGKAQIHDLIFGSGKYSVDRKEFGDNIGSQKNYAIFGMPPTFLHTTDYIPKGFDYGRNYIENILIDGALLSIIPGVPDFLAELTDKQKEEILRELAKPENKPEDPKTLEAILDGKHARYYSLKPDLTAYYNYVNTILTHMATMLNIDEIPGMGKVRNLIKNKGLDFSKYMDSPSMNAFYDLNSFDRSISFFMDAQQSDAREDFSNSTTQSSLAGLAKGVTDKVKEAQFVSAGKINNLDMLNPDARNEAADPGLFKTLKDTGHVITSGGNVMFPEIWADSSITKSYNVSFKLQSPTGAREDIFLYVLVPYVHLLCLVGPRQITSNGFISPFLVRAFSKGWFNCDLGLVESMTITRGQDGAWSYEGLPTEVNVSLSIKDLYSTFSIADGEDTSRYFANIGLIDHVCTLCGVNMHTIEPKRSVLSYLSVWLAHGWIDTAISGTMESIVHKAKTSIIGKLLSLGN